MVSLVVPVYNMEKYIDRCMRTLLNQDCMDYEIILIDDGSTDSSAVICDKYARENPELVRVIHKENGGLSSARNAGIDVAKGDYIVFPDPDDWAESNYVSELIEYQNKYKSDLICLGYFVEYDDKMILANNGQRFWQMNGKEAQYALIGPPYMGGFAWNKLYRVDIIKKYHLKFLNDVGTTEDLDFAFRYLQYCNTVCFIPEIRVYHYYQREGAATHSSFSKRKLESIHTYEKIIKHSVGNEKLMQLAREEICNTVINLLWEYQNSGCKDRKLKEKLKKHIRINLKAYLQSDRFGVGRKVQAVLAWLSPALYSLLKNCVTTE